MSNVSEFVKETNFPYKVYMVVFRNHSKWLFIIFFS